MGGDWWSTHAPGLNVPPAIAIDPATGRTYDPAQGIPSPGSADPSQRRYGGGGLMGGTIARARQRPAAPAGSSGQPYTFSGTPTLQDLQRYFTSRGVDPQEAPYWLSKWSELVARGQELGDPGYAMRRLSQAQAFAGTSYDVGRAPSAAGPGAGAPPPGGIGASPEGPFSGIPPYQPSPFVPPTGLTYQNDPGFLERMRLGSRAIQESAAAKGSILSGGTLKALERYAQDYASGEFGNVYGRALQTYGTNLGAGQLGYQNRYGQYTDYMGFLRDAADRGLRGAGMTYQRPGG